MEKERNKKNRRRRKRLLPLLVIAISALTALLIARQDTGTAFSQTGWPSDATDKPKPVNRPATDTDTTAPLVSSSESANTPADGPNAPAGPDQSTDHAGPSDENQRPETAPDHDDASPDDQGPEDDENDRAIAPIIVLRDPDMPAPGLPAPLESNPALPLPDTPEPPDGGGGPGEVPADSPDPARDSDDENDAPSDDDPRSGAVPIPIPLPIPVPSPRPMPLPLPTLAPSPRPTPPEPEPTPVPRPEPGGDYYVQVHATPHEHSICEIWQSLKDAFPDLFAYAEQSVSRLDKADGSIWFRLRVGSFENYDDAAAFCARLKRDGHECFVASGSRRSNDQAAP